MHNARIINDQYSLDKNKIIKKEKLHAILVQQKYNILLRTEMEISDVKLI